MLGKSTLQNELVGDLHVELGILPDGAEDLPLQSLGALSGASFSGQTGKVLSSLISKLVSSKMPAGFNQNAIRDHLRTYWGLGPNRQTAILSYAATAPPNARLSSIEAAQDFINNTAVRYGKFAQLSLAPVSRDSNSTTSPNVVGPDPESIRIAAQAQRRFLQDQYDVLRNHLQVDSVSTEQETLGSEASLKRLEEQVETWYHEFGEEFLAGAEGKFDPDKARAYDSYWNWARSDLINLFYDVQSNRLSPTSHEANQRVELLLQKWDPSCGEIVGQYVLGQDACSSESKPFWQMLQSRSVEAAAQPPSYRFVWEGTAPRCVIKENGDIECFEVPRSQVHTPKEYRQMIESGLTSPEATYRSPFVRLCRQIENQWTEDEDATAKFMDRLSFGARTGFTFNGKTVLVTGAGPQSIGAEIVRYLLTSGARVILTTSRSVSQAAKFFNSLYKQYGARGSKLTVLQFNQGSKSDCEALVDHIYRSESEFDTDIDFIIPFAALPESGRQIDGLDGKSELAHRAMLVNILRLLGYVKQYKHDRGFNTRPTNVIVPLSPNHGIFGGDGLYSESKIGLETLFNRWRSESWSDYLTICGAVIGWTRGTAIMEQNDTVAEAIESHNILTFSQAEMAYNILALMTPEVAVLCEDAPLYADLSGGLLIVDGLKDILTSARKSILKESTIRKALIAEDVRHQTVLKATPAIVDSRAARRQRARIELDYPRLKSHHDTKTNLPDLQGMPDLSRTVVVVGFSDLSPWGNSRTRWDMEHLGSLSLEKWIEMAWIMGLVQHRTCDVDGKPYSGWFDVKNNHPIADDEFESRYSEEILTHSGIRLIEPEGLGGYDPERKEFLQEIVVDRDLPSFETSKDNAEAFKLRHGEKAVVSLIAGSEDYRVTIKKGSHFLVPKAVPFDRTVAGQLPRGWDPSKYGIPGDIVSQVDPITLYALCCTCEALWSAGIEDPFELYRHIHVSELANCIGTGVGGLLSMRGVYRDRYLERPVQHDILQESYLNAIGAWTNMLLLASTGPIKSPVGTCATAVESLDIGCEAIRSGRAKVAFVGGSDDFQEEMSYEFANMKATASAVEHLKAGRLPSEMSRPTTSSRQGFVESAGAGVQMIMNAELALKMGLPVYAIITHTQMAGDGIGRSVPAPGQGVLTAARESPDASSSPLLDLDSRRAQLFSIISDTESLRQQRLAMQPSSKETAEAINQASDLQIREVKNVWTNDIRIQNPDISPIKASLATWGLTVDDIGVVSLHGTSTKANDKNESMVINKQMTHLGRSKGNPALAISQKYLTGHPKGAAGAWMLNGCLQVLQSGSVPGNRNADNIDKNLRQFDHLIYPAETVRTSGIKAFMLTSFGFGQKGGLVVAVAPQYLFASVSEATYEDYRQRTLARQQHANIGFMKGLMSNQIFKAKTESPWHDIGEGAVFLNPEARVTANTKGDLTFNAERFRPSKNFAAEKLQYEITAPLPPLVQPEPIQAQADPTLATFCESGQAWLDGMTLGSNPQTTVGVDVENLDSVPTSNRTFIERNFTDSERDYCNSAADPTASFAGRWAAKEAVFKSLHTPSLGAGQAMNEIEIQSKGGVPKIKVRISSSNYHSDYQNYKHQLICDSATW